MPEHTDEPPTDNVADNVEQAELSGHIETQRAKGRSKIDRFKIWYGAHKRWTIPASILLVIILISAIIPATRYRVLGLAIKKNFTLKLIDSTTNTPVSGVMVNCGGKSAQTNGNGTANIKLPIGPRQCMFTKKYYDQTQATLMVPLFKEKNIPSISLNANGRLVEIDVTNLINQKILAGVSITVDDINAKTDSTGKAIMAVPAGLTTAQAKLSLDGYNDSTQNITISDRQVARNNLSLTPAGKVYFLSKLSGSIDVVKANLDGSGRTTVIGGTGQEDDSNTVLLASRDWKYLALLAQREANKTKLYVINTNDERLLTMDEGSATFQPVGWYNHFFIYTVSRDGYNAWQPNAVSIKSYNADTGQILTLANSNATGSSNADAQYEAFFNTLIVGNDVMFTRTWYKYPGYLSTPGQQNTLSAIRPDGSNSRVLKSVDAATFYISSLKLNKPDQLYFGVFNNNTADVTYYSTDGSSVNPNNSITGKDLVGETTSYLASPSGNQTFWQDERDGKNTLFVGDQNGGNGRQIATLSGYSAYGWYSDNYLLVSKDSDELYVIPVTGISKDSDAIKITDYHKPAQNFYGYGGGYGGL